MYIRMHVDACMLYVVHRRSVVGLRIWGNLGQERKKWFVHFDYCLDRIKSGVYNINIHSQSMTVLCWSVQVTCWAL